MQGKCKSKKILYMTSKLLHLHNIGVHVRHGMVIDFSFFLSKVKIGVFSGDENLI